MHGLVIKFQHTLQGTVQYDSTPRLSKGIQNKYVGFMQRKPKKKKELDLQYGGQRHGWMAFLIKIMHLGMGPRKRWKDLY